MAKAAIVGDIVHYIQEGNPRAAIVTMVHPDGSLNVRAFQDTDLGDSNAQTVKATEVPYDPTGLVNETWCWPEKNRQEAS